MGTPQLRAEASQEPLSGFRTHVETGRGRGSLTTVLFVPADPADALTRALSCLHSESLDVETRLGRVASAAPGAAFLVGLGRQAWVLPSDRLRVRRVRASGVEPLDEPQIVTLRPGERVEMVDGEAVVGALACPAAPKPTIPARRPHRGTPRLSARRVVPLAHNDPVPLVVQPRRLGQIRLDEHIRHEEQIVGMLTEGVAANSEKVREPEVSEGTAVVEEEPVASAPAPEEVAPAGPAPPAEPWSFEAGGPISSSPLVVAGRVIVGSRDSTLYCLDARTGEIEWRLAAGAGIGSSPREAAGTCFVGTYAGDLLACDLETGELRWRAATKGKIVSSPCVEAGRVMVGSYDRSIHAFDVETGEPVWRVATGSRVRASPERIADGIVAVGSTDGSVYALAVADGQLRWKRRTSSAILAAVAHDPTRHRVVAAGQDGSVLCLDAGTGEVVWKAALGAERLVVIGTGQGRLHALDPETGEALWNVDADRGFDARPLVRGDHLVAPSFDGVVHLVGLADGTVLERRPLGAEVFSSPASAGELVVVGTLAGTLHALTLP